ncbi:LOW QUALITY PROTEIN: hypothetical protein Cgig2_006474 [Carnegiea gigantea]|uniref:Uncharacterized protein n=1 Tax=Carnegiea gigantea TaxID=171969 RepID=A0A9Q1JVV4_9CARY|nr:LOW QUALITY PROTEIN: hypothetical protein Cgig2_006474 [Carnegiea gigantea]
MSVTLQREPTIDELSKDTHQHKTMDKQRIWCIKNQNEQTKRWQEYRSSQPSTDDSSQSPPLSERDIWVQGNLTSMGHVYGFGARELNYDAREMATRLNGSVNKVVEDAHQEEFRKQVEEEVRAKLINSSINGLRRKLEFDLAQEKAARQQDNKKVESKMSKMQRFFTSQQAGSSTAPPDTTSSEDDDEDDVDEVDTTNLRDDSHV